MPIYKIKNENFFKKWSPEMAYVLGFIAADGSLVENKCGAHFLDICSTDKEIIYRIKRILKSNHKVSKYCH